MRSSFFILPLILLASCYKTLEIELPEQPAFTAVIPDVIPSGDTVRFYLRRSCLITDYKTINSYFYFRGGNFNVEGLHAATDSLDKVNFPFIQNAAVRITGTDNSSRVLTQKKAGEYFRRFSFIPGITYTMTVEENGREPITGSFTYPEAPVAEISGPYEAADRVRYRVKIYLSENQQDHYYTFRSNDELLSDSPYFEDRESDSFETVLDPSGNWLRYIYGSPISIKGQRGGVIEFDIYVENLGFSGDKTELSITSQPYELYEFERTLDLNSYVSGDPFAQPIEVYTNLSFPGRGVFARGNMVTYMLQ